MIVSRVLELMTTPSSIIFQKVGARLLLSGPSWSNVVFVCFGFRLPLSPLLWFIAVLWLFLFYYDFSMIRKRILRANRTYNCNFQMYQKRARFRSSKTSFKPRPTSSHPNSCFCWPFKGESYFSVLLYLYVGYCKYAPCLILVILFVPHHFFNLKQCWVIWCPTLRWSK